MPYHALAFRLPCGSQDHNTFLSYVSLRSTVGKHKTPLLVWTHIRELSDEVSHTNNTIRHFASAFFWTTASRTKRCPFRSVTASTFTTKHPLRRRILENGSGAALHHHSLNNEKSRSFAALRRRQEMNLTHDCNHLQLRIRSLLPSCRATAHAHL